MFDVRIVGARAECSCPDINDEHEYGNSSVPVITVSETENMLLIETIYRLCESLSVCGHHSLASNPVLSPKQSPP